MTDTPNQHASQPRPQRVVTGRMVLACLVAFFATVAAVNAVMMTAAMTTFGGLETASSYKAGLEFTRDSAAAAEQQARGWRITAQLYPRPDGMAQVDLSAFDATGRPLAGYHATVLLAHPTNRRLDRDIAVAVSGPGQFVGGAAVPSGQWDLIIELRRDGERLFRSRQRVTFDGQVKS